MSTNRLFINTLKTIDLTLLPEKQAFYVKDETRWVVQSANLIEEQSHATCLKLIRLLLLCLLRNLNSTV